MPLGEGKTSSHRKREQLEGKQQRRKERSGSCRGEGIERLKVGIIGLDT